MTHTSDSAKVAFQRLCAKFDTPYALKASLLLKRSDRDFVEQLTMPQPCHYRRASDFRKDYLIYNYLRKYVGLSSGIDTKEAALSKWRSAEEQCRIANKNLKSGSYLTYDVESALLRARHKIARVLGTFSYDKVLGGTGMGPGATFDLSRRARPGIKYSLPISVTGSALNFAKAWLEHDVHWFSNGSGDLPDGPYCVLDSNFIVTQGNKLTTVPKDSSNDRVICIEPTFNLFIQKGVGKYIRRRLKRFGVNLDDQSRNQQLAHLAYALGLATIDLSSASDTICDELVKILLPLDWWYFLDLIRSKRTRISKEWVDNQKFSSMGNGFTFELETLIFWALCPEGVEHHAVFGDDIICDQSKAPEYITILEGCGFTINRAKSFVEGPFFESCGKHYFEGEDVSPCFQKERIVTSSALVRAHNRLFKIHDRVYGQETKESPELYAAQVFFDAYKYERKPLVPHTADDRGFYTYRLSSFQYCPNRGYKCPVLKVPKRLLRTYSDGLYIRKLHDPFSESPLDPFSSLTSVAGMESNAKLKFSWIQPYQLTSEFLPEYRRTERLASPSSHREMLEGQI
jgi:hypothetical protein